LFRLLVFSGQSARAGQTLAKQAIKVKKSAVGEASHRFHPFVQNGSHTITGPMRACQVFSKATARQPHLDCTQTIGGRRPSLHTDTEDMGAVSSRNSPLIIAGGNRACIAPEVSLQASP
jgi:hypothetical protein